MSYLKLNHRATLLTFFIVSGLFSSCDPNRVYEKNIEIPGYQWNYDNIAGFEVPITDTTQLYNIYVNLRHTYFYEFSNVWLKIHTVFPDGKELEQRVQIELADKKGKWHSDCSGDICDYRALIQQNAYFNQTGTYTFKLEQVMRKNPLPYIMAVGLRIEKAGEKE